MGMDVAGADSDGGGWNARLFQVGCSSIGSPFGAVVLVLDAGFFGCCEQEVPHIGQEDVAWIIKTKESPLADGSLVPKDIARRGAVDRQEDFGVKFCG